MWCICKVKGVLLVLWAVLLQAFKVSSYDQSLKCVICSTFNLRPPEGGWAAVERRLGGDQTILSPTGQGGDHSFTQFHITSSFSFLRFSYVVCPYVSFLWCQGDHWLQPGGVPLDPGELSKLCPLGPEYRRRSSPGTYVYIQILHLKLA